MNWNFRMIFPKYFIILFIISLANRINSQSLPADKVLQINCTEAVEAYNNPSYTACADYIVDYIKAYAGVTPNNPMTAFPTQSYDADTIPIPPFNTESNTFYQGNKLGINVYALIELESLVGIDTDEGTVTATININLLWNDFRLAWNSSLTPYVSMVNIDSDVIWTPDITLFNQAAGSMIVDAPVQLASNGVCWLRRQGYVTFTCGFALKKFPFDLQSCPMDFASWQYFESQLKLIIYPLQFSPIAAENMLMSPSFEGSISWNLTSFVPSNETIGTFYGNFSHIYYTITCSRYSNYYIYSAIIPEITVTTITVIALWIPDINARMGLSVTSLLMVIAVMWTVSDGLPLTESATWMERFSNFCTFTIGFCCIENAIVAYVTNKKTTPPKWLIYYVYASNIFLILYELMERRENRDEVDKHVNDIEMKNPFGNTQNIKTDIKERRDRDYENDDRPRSNNITINPMIDSAKSPVGQQSDNSNNNDINDDDSPLLGSDSSELSWAKVGRATDRISRALFPFIFIIGAIKFAAESQSN